MNEEIAVIIRMAAGLGSVTPMGVLEPCGFSSYLYYTWELAITIGCIYKRVLEVGYEVFDAHRTPR